MPVRPPAVVAVVLSPGRLAVLLGLLFGLAGTSTSAVTVALPQLAADLGVSESTAAWMVSAYVVAVAVATPTYGRLADMLGIRRPLCAGVVAMALGAVGAALAPTFAVLVVARVVQGLGAAAVPVLAVALVTARFVEPARTAALGRIAGVAATLSATGPLLGGALATIGWRWAVALPVVGALALPLLWRAAPTGGSGERVDLPGALFVAAAATGLVLLLQSPGTGAAVAAVGVGLLAVGVPAVAARVRARPDGFLPRAVITNAAVLRSSFAAGAVPASWFALLLGVPLAASAWGWSPLATGALLLPAALAGFGSPRVARALVGRLGPHRSMVVSCSIAVGALLIAALGAAAAAPGLLAVAVAGVTVAFGIGQPALVALVSAAVPAPQRGVALGVATLVFLVGASVGAAVVGGLAGPVGVPLAFCVLTVLPLAGVAVLLRAGAVDRA